MSFESLSNKLWMLLHKEIDPSQEFPNVSPLLAHYTSLQNLENILRNREVWLSNPLYMNDLEEVRFGVNSGVDIVLESSDLNSALGTKERSKAFQDAFIHYFNEYGNDEVLDLYVMCFSLHSESETDGKLSMWRGYGQNGKGCALVFDAAKLSATDDSPLALAKVEYQTQEQRRKAISEKVLEVAGFIEKNAIEDDDLYQVAYALFRRICLYAVFSKHKGFDEEAEWRIVYFKERDPEKKLHEYFSYFNGPDGIQPKLKLPTRPIPGVIGEHFELTDVIHSIIVGPSASSPLVQASVERMLRDVGMGILVERLKMSGIPYRG